jgi:hypothetical protein
VLRGPHHLLVGWVGVVGGWAGGVGLMYGTMSVLLVRPPQKPELEQVLMAPSHWQWFWLELLQVLGPSALLASFQLKGSTLTDTRCCDLHGSAHAFWLGFGAVMRHVYMRHGQPWLGTTGQDMLCALGDAGP